MTVPDMEPIKQWSIFTRRHERMQTYKKRPREALDTLTRGLDATRRHLAMSIAYLPEHIEATHPRLCDQCGTEMYRRKGERTPAWNRRKFCTIDCFRKSGSLQDGRRFNVAVFVENAEWLITCGTPAIDVARRADPNKQLSIEAAAKRLHVVGRHDLAALLDRDIKWDRVAA